MSAHAGHFVFGDEHEGISMVKKVGDKLMMSVKWKKPQPWTLSKNLNIERMSILTRT